MKKRTKQLQCSMGPVRLYLDDIRELVRVMGELPSAGELNIQSGDYEFTGVEDLANSPEAVLRELRITCGNTLSSSIWLSIDGSNVYLSSRKDAIAHFGVYTQIKALLQSRRPKWSWLSQVRTVRAVTILAAVGLILVLAGGITGVAPLVWVGFWATGLGLLFLAVTLTTHTLGKSAIILQERSEQESFLQRNKDSIALVLITALVTMIFSVFGTLIVLAITGVNPFLTTP